MSEQKEQNRKSSGPQGRKNGGARAGEKPKEFKKTFRRLLSYLKPYRLRLFAVFLLAIFSCAFSVVGPKILGLSTTAVSDGVISGGIDFTYITRLLLFLLGLYIASSLFMIVQGFILTSIAQNLSYRFRKEIDEKINRLPLKYFDTRSTGEVLSHLTNDVDTLSQTFNQSISQILSSLFTVIGVVVMMLLISVQMTLVVVMVVPLSLLAIRFIVKRSQKYFILQQQYLGHVNGQVEENFSGHIVVKAFNAEKYTYEAFSETNDTLYQVAWKAQFLSSIMMPVMGFIGNLGYVGVCIAGGILTVRRSIAVGDILSFVQYVRNFTQPLTQSAQVANVLQATAAAAERIFLFLSESEETPDTDFGVDTDTIKGHVAFENISFGYLPDKTVINHFNASIKAGQRVAIVGPTGAGKTTLVKLLMRFYDVNEGKITVDGVNIRDFKRKDLRSMFGMVLQDSWLFSGTVMENIRYGHLDASDEDVVNAAKAAYIHHYIKTQPDGYQMEINEETTNISQGQKQLLTIARCLLSDPKILILDEATSSVDTRTELLIQKAMSKLMANRTSFIIAHRLSTIRDADLILVINQGDIVEQGTHSQLIAAEGFYYQLYNSQFDNKESA